MISKQSFKLPFCELSSASLTQALADFLKSPSSSYSKLHFSLSSFHFISLYFTPFSFIPKKARPFGFEFFLFLSLPKVTCMPTYLFSLSVMIWSRSPSLHCAQPINRQNNPLGAGRRIKKLCLKLILNYPLPVFM